MNRLYFGNNLKWLSYRKEFPDASVDLVNGNERIHAPPEINPFAMAAREAKQHEQVEML